MQTTQKKLHSGQTPSEKAVDSKKKKLTNKMRK